jgi:hypothetical protein
VRSAENGELPSYSANADALNSSLLPPPQTNQPRGHFQTRWRWGGDDDVVEGGYSRKWSRGGRGTPVGQAPGVAASISASILLVAAALAGCALKHTHANKHTPLGLLLLQWQMLAGWGGGFQNRNFPPTNSLQCQA